MKRRKQNSWRCLVLSILFLAELASAQSLWKAGAAKVKITPDEPIWLAGYANRTKPSEGVLQDIFVKALALQDSTGKTSVLVTSDLVGFDRAMIDTVAGRVKTEFGLSQDRLILNASHNHSCPVTGEVLHLFYPLDNQQKQVVQRYTTKLLDQIVGLVGRSIQDLTPAELGFGQGLAGLAVNRRRARPGGRGLPGPVDHDVPVLSVRAKDGKVKAIVFGYACHTTTLSGYKINGDYAGFAQASLERKYPDSIALFVAGCGSDANPLPRIRQSDSDAAVELARRYGETLAASVDLVLQEKLYPVSGLLQTAFERVEVFFQTRPSREELLIRLEGKEGLERRELENLLKILDRGERLLDRALYPIQVWQFGKSLKLIALGGEPVADYSLRFKGRYGWDNTWVAGYSNELLAYIPSLRVLREGGYEGGEAMAEYGLPAPFSGSVEEIIAEKVDELILKTSPRE